MSGFLHALVTQGFLQRALLAGLLAAVGCGVVGTYVVTRRIGYLAGGIAHTVLGGMGIAYFLGAAPMTGAVVAALFAAGVIGWVSLSQRAEEDVLIGAFWAVGMALGVVFLSRSPGYNVDLMSYLFGSILLVPAGDLWLMGALDLAIGVTVALFWKQLLAVAFDETFARLRGVAVGAVYILLLAMVALTVVLLIRVVGLVLVIALLTLPAAIAGQYRRTVLGMMVLATVLGAAFTVLGLWVSYGPDLPAGATIILVAGVAYVGSTGIVSLRRWLRARARRDARARAPGGAPGPGAPGRRW